MLSTTPALDDFLHPGVAQSAWAHALRGDALERHLADGPEAVGPSDLADEEGRRSAALFTMSAAYDIDAISVSRCHKPVLVRERADRDRLPQLLRNFIDKNSAFA